MSENDSFTTNRVNVSDPNFTQKIDLSLPTGFTYRPGRMADAQIVTDVLNADALASTGIEPFSYDECIQEWTTPGFDVEDVSIVVFAPNGRLAGYIEVWDIDEVPTRIEILGATHPDFNGRGVGTFLLNWAHERAKQALPRVPVDLRVVTITSAPELHDPSNALLSNFGMEMTRVFLAMLINLDQPIPEPQWPESIRLKSCAEFDDMERVYKVYEETFADHWGHTANHGEDGYKQFLHRTEDPDFDPSLWFLAFDGDEIAAVSLCLPKSDENPEIGNVNILGVRRPWRRQGLALALLYHSFRAFQKRGRFKQVGLQVDAQSLTGAARLYEKAGMHKERAYLLYEKVLRDGRDPLTREIGS